VTEVFYDGGTPFSTFSPAGAVIDSGRPLGPWVITLGGLNLNGAYGDSIIKALDVQNWSAGPGTTGTVTQNAYSHGGWIDEAFDTSPRYIIPGTVKGPNQVTVREAITALIAAIPRNELGNLTVDEGGLVRTAKVRLDQAPPSIVWLTDTLAQFSIQLVAPDARLLEGNGNGYSFESGQVRLPHTTGGLRIKPGGLRIRPLRINAVVNSGSAVLTTRGNTTPPTLIRVRGPLPDFTITATTGDRIQVQTYTQAVPAGQYVDIDLAARTVKINGQVNRRNHLVGNWIEPANGTLFRFTSSTYNTTASMEIFSSSAWR
jgi:hypothetical protein